MADHGVPLLMTAVGWAAPGAMKDYVLKADMLKKKDGTPYVRPEYQDIAASGITAAIGMVLMFWQSKARGRTKEWVGRMGGPMVLGSVIRALYSVSDLALPKATVDPTTKKLTGGFGATVRRVMGLQALPAATTPAQTGAAPGKPAGTPPKTPAQKEVKKQQRAADAAATTSAAAAAGKAITYDDLYNKYGATIICVYDAGDDAFYNAAGQELNDTKEGVFFIASDSTTHGNKAILVDLKGQPWKATGIDKDADVITSGMYNDPQNPGQAMAGFDVGYDLAGMGPAPGYDLQGMDFATGYDLQGFDVGYDMQGFDVGYDLSGGNPWGEPF
jgi:hypothetical protein